MVDKKPTNGQLSLNTDDPGSIGSDRGALNPEQIVTILKGYNTDLSPEEARMIMEFMSRWAKIVLTQYLEK